MAATISIVSVIIFNNLNPVLSNLISVDLATCKLTHTGTEYIGKISHSETNISCQFWNSATYKGSGELMDEAFPDGSKILAKNYCRNPNKNPKGPWCYTTNKLLKNDTCDIPLCKSTDCRITGPGMEYTGSIQKSTSGKVCSKWKKKHRLKGGERQSLFRNKFFGDGSIDLAGNKCRNPDGNFSGPWCYVDTDESDTYAKELCDVPFCDDLDSFVYSEGSYSDGYFFYSSLNETQSLNVSFRLWNPNDWLGGEVYLHLSAYDIAANREDIERWSSGVEILFSHSGSGVLAGEEDTLMKTPFILSGAKWTNLQITWVDIENSSLLIQVFQDSKAKPVAMGEIVKEGTIFEVESFRFFSLMGSPILWNIHSSEDDCLVHTVSQMNFTRFWLIKKTTLSKDIDMFVRAYRDAVIMLRSSPKIATNQIQITIGVTDKIRVLTFENETTSKQLIETSRPNILNFWKWEGFKITIIREKLQLYWVQKVSTELILETTHANIENVMWVTFASPIVSYWAIYCDPRGMSDPPPAAPPECVSQESELFTGTLSVTLKGRHCIPWTDKTSIPDKFQNDDLFTVYGGRTSCQNFCRNLDNDPKGAFCFVRDPNSDLGFGLEHCHPRSCSLGDCKLAGTGNDYIGHINKTRSKRDCRNWLEVKDAIVDIKNFPDPTLEDAGNYCRNPSKSISGSWCFTNDVRVPKDSCYIKDCDKPLQCTILISGYIKGAYMYILPHWRKYGVEFWLKTWNPDIYEGLIITLSSLDFSEEYKLVIGDEENEKVNLKYKSQRFEFPLLRKTLPHLVPSGKWGGYWLRAQSGKIELGYYGVPTSFFEWSTSNEHLSFNPMYINFGTTKNSWIGVNFKCNECLLEKITIEKDNKMFPINLWKDDEPLISNLHLNLRGTGVAIVTLMWTEDFNERLAIEIYSTSNYISIVEYSDRRSQELGKFPVNAGISQDIWSEYIIGFTEDSLTVHKDGSHLFEWPSPFPLLFYWFTVTAKDGWVIWSANCPPADIDGEPRDGNWGGWGPWSCTVTCGTGEGRIERLCNNPPPNVFGKECKGSPVYEGACNDFPCGEISPDTNNLIRRYLSTQQKSLQVDATEKVILPCNSRGVSLITSEVSQANITWTHNGFPYSRIKFHMDENYSLVISHAQEKHNGVYICLAYQDPTSILSKVILEVVSLVVIKQKPTRKIRQGGSMTLKCNAIALSYVYADLSQKWELNGIVWKDYGLGSLQTFTMDKVLNISDSHAGIWTCVVTQEDLGFAWTTNWINLKVTSAPSFWSYLMEDVATAPIFGKLGSEKNVMILFLGLVTLLLLVIIVVTVVLINLVRK